MLSLNKLRAPLWLGTAVLVLSACGGGGGSSADGTNNAKRLDGSVVKGPVSNAQVGIRSVNPITGEIGDTELASTTTGAGGEFSFDLSTLNGPLVLQSRGGNFIDESDQNNDGGLPRQVQLSINSGFQVFRPEGVTTVALTMISDALTNRALQFAATNQVSFAAAFDAVRSLTVNAIGFDPITTAALDPVAPNSTDPDEIRYALLLGGLAQAANEIAIRVGLTGIDESVIAAVVQDFSDGKLDGLNGQQAIQLNNQTMPDIDIEAAIRTFRNNNRPAYPTAVVPVVDENTWSQALLPANTPPTISVNQQALVVGEGQALVLDSDVLTVTDAETAVANLGFVLLDAPTVGSISNGQTVVAVNNAPVASLQYNDLGLGLSETDTFSIAVIDEGGAFDVAQLVVGVDLAPIAQDDTVTVAEDTLATVAVLTNDSDPEQGALTITAVSNEVNGAAVIDNANVQFVPNPNFSGVASFDYSIEDGFGNSATASVTVNVTPVDDSPTISDIGNVSTLSGTATAPISFTFDDVDTPSVSIAASSGNTTLLPNNPSNISLSSSGQNGSLVLTPAPGETGTALVTVTVDDGNSSASDTFTLTVTDAPIQDADGDGVPDGDDQCSDTPEQEQADPTGCSPSQLPLVMDGSFKVVALSIGQGGPGPAEFTQNQFSNTQFEIEPYSLNINNLAVSGSEGDDQQVSLTRFNGGGDIFTSSFNDCQQNPQDCLFSGTFVRVDDVLFESGFVDSNINNFGQGDQVEFDIAPRISFVPVVEGGSLQALIATENSTYFGFIAADVDDDSVADPDLADPEYESSLEPETGPVGIGANGRFSLAIKAPEEAHQQSELAGSFGYIGYVQLAEQGGAPNTFRATAESLRANLTVDAAGAITGSFVGGAEILSTESGDVQFDTITAVPLELGSQLLLDVQGAPGDVQITFVESDEQQNDTITLDGFLSEDTSVGAFSFFEAEVVEPQPPTSVEAEVGVLVRRATAAPDIANRNYRFSMLGREFGCGFDSIAVMVRNAELQIGAEITNGCSAVLGASTQCFTASLNTVDAHSYLEARHQRINGNAFGELTLKGEASEGDFFPGNAVSTPAIVKVSNDGLVRIELFESLPDPQNPPPVEDLYNGFVSPGGTVVFEGGFQEINTQDCDYATRFIGTAVEVVGTQANATLDNRAPEVDSVTPSAPLQVASGGTVTLTASASDNENDTLSFNWVARSGSLSNADTASVTWTAPNTDLGSTFLELTVSDGINTTLEMVPVQWGVPLASNDEKLSGELVIDAVTLLPRDVEERFLLATPSEDNFFCLSGTSNRNFTQNSQSGTIEDPDVGDTIDVTFSSCVTVDDGNFRDSLASGSWLITITSRDDQQGTLGWSVQATDVVFLYEECDGAGANCVVEDENTVNAGFTVDAAEVTPEAGPPNGATVQVDHAIGLTGDYLIAEAEPNPSNGNQIELAETVTINQSSAFLFTFWEDDTPATLAARVGGGGQFTSRKPQAQSDFVDLTIGFAPEGLTRFFDQSNTLEGGVSYTVTAFDTAPLAVDWVMDVAYRPTVNNDIDVLIDDTSAQQNGFELRFSTTLQQIQDADECDLSSPPAGCPAL